MKNHDVLLCAFVEAAAELQPAIDYVQRLYSPPRIFILESQSKNDGRLALIFNVDEETLETVQLVNDARKMIRVHRNSGTNTLFTLNALNVIKDNKGSVNWPQHRNKILTTNKGRLREFRTRLNQIIK